MIFQAVVVDGGLGMSPVVRNGRHKVKQSDRYLIERDMGSRGFYVWAVSQCGAIFEIGHASESEVRRLLSAQDNQVIAG